MRILDARKATSVSGAEKFDLGVQSDTITPNEQAAGEARQDALDMRKLGVRQETKVCARLKFCSAIAIY